MPKGWTMTTSGGLRRRGLSALGGAVLAVALVVLLPGQASAFVPPNLGDWPGARAVRVLPLAPKPAYPLPSSSGHGRRLVYSERTMHVWAVDSHGTVVKDWKVSGRPDWPNAGTYHVFSKSEWSRSTISNVGASPTATPRTSASTASRTTRTGT